MKFSVRLLYCIPISAIRDMKVEDKNENPSMKMFLFIRIRYVLWSNKEKKKREIGNIKKLISWSKEKKSQGLVGYVSGNINWWLSLLCFAY